ncbi:uncharacterized protein C8R40DRAFT_1166315 [Lentinula edodes]|uniref:uncharacterized protein n=1 Tax=Lentinula edodes TaxID=5353 RepID=UPI001E8D6F09|nr:uncharacterized protein C8R40DRAFT_1166315 [Lentinula edodes]KAH7880121.1 hypothetical protein C8R40DRAFT_1166315 [Lentinula edodes]
MDNPGSNDPSSECSHKLGHSTHSSMSLASSSTLLEDQDEDVRIAVRALGDMKSGNFGGSLSKTVATPASYLSSTSPISTTSIPSPTLSSLSISSISNHDAQLEPDFVSRMAHIPIVNGALRIYEQGKASSRVVKYGAEIMESGVKTISKPVIDRLPTGQLDEFACRQLDRVSYNRLTFYYSLRILVLLSFTFFTVGCLRLAPRARNHIWDSDEFIL